MEPAIYILNILEPYTNHRSPEWSSRQPRIPAIAETVSSTLVKIGIFIVASVAESVRTRRIKLNHWLTNCKSAELASRYTSIRRERGTDGKIIRDYRKDVNVAVEMGLVT